MKSRNTNNKRWFIILGKNSKDYFDLNLTKDKQMDLVRNLKRMKWEKVFHYQEKHYHFEDMKYIIDNRNKHFCFKTKVLSYDIQPNALIGQLSMISLPIDKFPPITQYHDMMIAERTVFINDTIQIHVRVVNNQDGMVSYEIRIESSNKDDAIRYANNLNYTLNEFEPKYINHGSYYIMSLI